MNKFYWGLHSEIDVQAAFLQEFVGLHFLLDTDKVGEAQFWSETEQKDSRNNRPDYLVCRWKVCCEKIPFKSICCN